MVYEIVQVRLGNPYGTTEDRITEVKLSTGNVQTVRDVVNYINSYHEYYFTDRNGNQTYVEVVPFQGRSSYIRTKPNQTTTDNLLSLPRF